jgi:uncharacterized membrane protein
MTNYPVAVNNIANDYLERVTARLRAVPTQEREEFLRELRSHIFEAYQASANPEEVTRMLAVLRNIGEPADVVADRLPAAMIHSGYKFQVPLHVLAGLLLAIFGLPIGFGGAGVILGLLGALTGATAAFFAATGAVLFAGTIFLILGLTRYSMPGIFDRLVEHGFITLKGPFELLNDLTSSDQALIFVLISAVFITAGVAMFWVGKRMVRGLLFIYSLVLDGVKRLAQSILRRARHARQHGVLWGGSYGNTDQQSAH